MTRAPFRICAANSSDVDAMAALETQCFEPNLCISARQFTYLLRRPTASIWVGRADDRLVGDVVVLRRRNAQGTLGRIYSLVIAMDHRGCGYARGLMQTALQSLREARAYAAVLEVHPHNIGAIRLYTELGFKPARLVQDYYAAGEHALKMHAHLL